MHVTSVGECHVSIVNADLEGFVLFLSSIVSGSYNTSSTGFHKTSGDKFSVDILCMDECSKVFHSLHNICQDTTFRYIQRVFHLATETLNKPCSLWSYS